MDIYYEDQKVKSEKRIREYQRLFQEQLSARQQQRKSDSGLEYPDAGEPDVPCPDDCPE